MYSGSLCMLLQHSTAYLVRLLLCGHLDGRLDDLLNLLIVFVGGGRLVVDCGYLSWTRELLEPLLMESVSINCCLRGGACAIVRDASPFRSRVFSSTYNCTQLQNLVISSGLFRSERRGRSPGLPLPLGSGNLYAARKTRSDLPTTASGWRAVVPRIDARH